MQHTQETVSREQATSSWADTSWQIPEGSEARGRRRKAGSVTRSTANRLVQGRQSRQQEIISLEKSAGKSCVSMENNLAKSVWRLVLKYRVDC